MKRAWFILFIAATLSAWAWAQEGAHQAPPPAEREHTAAAAEHAGADAAQEEGDKFIWWKWANFAILAVALGYMLGKALPPFFAGRTAEIQKGIAEAQRLKADAEQRAAAMERRIASLETEIDQIRTEARAEMAREGDRLRMEAEQQIARIQSKAAQEVAAITKAATQRLKAHSAELALQLAEQRIQARIDGPAQAALVERFIQQVDAGRQGNRL